MKNKIILLILPLLFTSIACAQIDENLAKKAEVVLRIQSGAIDECDKYCWQKVKILEELKNQNNYSFGETLSVASYSWDDGIPSGESTIYLEKYNPERNDLWKLLGGTRKTGVSHYNPEFKIYIESWDRISFDSHEPGWFSKIKAEAFLKKNINSAQSIEVMLGKNLSISSNGLDAEIDEIQRWLISVGFKNITFKLATSDVMPQVVRKYNDGKIINP